MTPRMLRSPGTYIGVTWSSQQNPRLSLNQAHGDPMTSLGSLTDQLFSFRLHAAHLFPACDPILNAFTITPIAMLGLSAAQVRLVIRGWTAIQCASDSRENTHGLFDMVRLTPGASYATLLSLMFTLLRSQPAGLEAADSPPLRSHLPQQRKRASP